MAEKKGKRGSLVHYEGYAQRFPGTALNLVVSVNRNSSRGCTLGLHSFSRPTQSYSTYRFLARANMHAAQDNISGRSRRVALA